MLAVQVNDAEGRLFTKILSGETVEQAKKRITFEGILENSDGLALRDDETITEEGAPYVFKPRMQQATATEVRFFRSFVDTSPVLFLLSSI
jgi:hypothetical protein